MADMTLVYEGVDITDSVDIVDCVFRDASGGEYDCLDMKLDHAERWLRWGPQKNDRIEARRGGYSTKTLYLNTIALEDGGYRILATGAKCGTFPARWQSYEGKTLQVIMSLCAGEMNMAAKLYGINGAIRYDYLMRRNLPAPAFLEELARMEGAVLKTLDGAFAMIGIEYAQAIRPSHTIELRADQEDAPYTEHGQPWGSVTIRTPFGSGTARANGVSGLNQVITDLPVDDDAQAYRWAKGLLMHHNRACEILRLETEFNPGYTAMGRVNVESNSKRSGEWIIDSVEHDLIGNKSRAKLYRCTGNVK